MKRGVVSLSAGVRTPMRQGRDGKRCCACTRPAPSAVTAPNTRNVRRSIDHGHRGRGDWACIATVMYQPLLMYATPAQLCLAGLRQSGRALVIHFGLFHEYGV